MNIISDFEEDVRHIPRRSGGYEWWYFDGTSHDGTYAFVVICYEGNPFSTRYNSLIAGGKEAKPAEYPAISISVYENGKTIYYSFTEFEERHCFFDEDQVRLQLGDHRIRGSREQEEITFELSLEEQLPSGDKIEATLEFKSSPASPGLLEEGESKAGGHSWNLVQPRADVRGQITLESAKEEPSIIEFEGRGYHDHNGGPEPLKGEFKDWYWGRFHFDIGTLVYYAMNANGEEDRRAWLISKDNRKLVESFDSIDFGDRGLTIFGLKVARKIGLRSSNMEVRIQQSDLLDNGPFYQRYRADAFLQYPAKKVVQSSRGISEYIRPGRIYNRLFWPLLDMRIRYKSEEPHWVQKSKTLYRWTW